MEVIIAALPYILIFLGGGLWTGVVFGAGIMWGSGMGKAMVKAAEAELAPGKTS